MNDVPFLDIDPCLSLALIYSTASLLFFKWANHALFFVYFRLFHTTQFKIQIDGVLGTRTQGGGMEGADQSTEL